MGWTGRGGMFLAPAGNPSSLRVGHPDVATEHTGLSPTILSPSPGRWSSGCGCTVWNDPRALGLGRVCAEAGRGILGLGTADSLPGDEDW